MSSLTKEQKQIILKMYQEDKIGSTTIARELGLTNSIVAYYINSTVGLRSCKEAARKYSLNEEYFNTIDTEEKAYWLGFLYADGYVSKSTTNQKNIGISLANIDYNHIVKFKKAISATYPIHTYVSKSGYSKNTIYSRLQITSDKMFNDLVKLGVVEHKTLTLKAPNIDECFYSHFIRGYIDGDGCITTHRPKNGRKIVQYAIKIVGTIDILNFIKKFIEANNLLTIHKYYKRKETDSVYNIDFGGNIQVKKFLDAIYYNATVFLDRKYKKYIDLCNLIHSRSALKNAD